jgi:membrane protein DedA with SNARE-associated domain
MIEQVLNFLESIGILGVYAVIFLEGSSLPFPGIAIILAFGGLLELSYADMALAAAGMSVTYSAASLIPYFIGKKMESTMRGKFRIGIQKASLLFNRYGIWSVAFSRPFGIGNYISYLAGMSNISVVRYMVLTFVGIYPWCYVMLTLGNFFNGNYDAVMSFYEQHSFYFYGASTAFFTIIVFCIYKRYQRHSLNDLILKNSYPKSCPQSRKIRHF